ncbi:MAG: AmmeMemoRadiSam system protein A [Brevinematia bacterium]
MISKDQKKAILKLARLSIESIFNSSLKQELEKQKKIVEKIGIHGGVFVTLTKNKELRGCIGYIYPIKPFPQLVVDAAISSATKDPRFDPLEKEEINQIEIEISILSEPKKIESISEIEVGKHGLIVRRGPFQGLLLPQVAIEHNWDKITFLQYTCIKAGLSPNDYKKEDTEIFVFTAEVFSESHLEDQ